jgi:hypothetical protein
MMCRPAAALPIGPAGHAVPASSATQCPCPCPHLTPVTEADDALAAMYLRMWSLATGRTLQPGVRPEDLTAEELVSFWADDLSPVAGRHAVRRVGVAEDAR